MKHTTLIIIIFLFVISFMNGKLWSQEKYDNNWVFGINNPYIPDIVPGYQIYYFNFDDYDLHIKLHGKKLKNLLEFWVSSTTLSDSEGNLQIATSGHRLFNEKIEIIPNGDSLNFNSLWDTALYYAPRETCLIVPEPGNEENAALVVHTPVKRVGKTFDFACEAVRITKVRLKNGIADTVLFKNVVIDTGLFEYISMCKHANGRDWWVLYPERYKDVVRRFMITPQGAGPVLTQSIEGAGFGTGSPHHRFSPNGEYYVTMHLDGIKRYDFDRCTGLLSNPIGWKASSIENRFAIFSKSSRYLYLSTDTASKLLQFDMNEPVLKADTVALLDTLYDSPEYKEGLYRFRNMQLAPDGKIYIQGGPHRMSVINDPDKGGKACKLTQWSLELPAYEYGSSNRMPNIRLGPLEGGCDTLGIYKKPLAKFRYVKDTLNKGLVEFIDLSDYDPTQWYWDFGDGGQSSEQRPLHTYKQTGVYNVCLTASNKHGSDTYCRYVDIGALATSDVLSTISCKAFPNPATDYIFISVSEPVYQSLRLKVSDVQGRILIQTRFDLQHGFNTLDISKLASGMYFVELQDCYGMRLNSKFVKQ
ncbi:MAG TPA: PKD domain-containing protein [Saprospiraceae bacterium]|nr:PKD domain-containing protein [Saprospiraceae bacterium]MCC6688755.1 PKD domain-containing protein [Saprospiraceae bacterium]HMV22911.1 PKD domain-containing protein [Saprospiraceae bacterium]HMX82565.1 PKD domain-containing protein [Saprospiraceae bacterium]HMX85984.1 PKD domain-containing protein [Saprospiraceae bacterium]